MNLNKCILVCEIFEMFAKIGIELLYIAFRLLLVELIFFLQVTDLKCGAGVGICNVADLLLCSLELIRKAVDLMFEIAA
jgi:hypothetical protein